MTLIWKFFTCLFGREQDVPLYGKIALPLLVVGVALMAPGWRDAALSYLNETYNLGLSLDAPWWVGAVFAGATNDVTRRRLRCRPGTAAAFGRTSEQTGASAAGG